MAIFSLICGYKTKLKIKSLLYPFISSSPHFSSSLMADRLNFIFLNEPSDWRYSFMVPFPLQKKEALRWRTWKCTVRGTLAVWASSPVNSTYSCRMKDGYPNSDPNFNLFIFLQILKLQQDRATVVLEGFKFRTFLSRNLKKYLGEILKLRTAPRAINAPYLSFELSETIVSFVDFMA